jgi:hypothetical protein
MTLSDAVTDPKTLSDTDRIATLEARLRRTQEVLADQMISRRLERDQIAMLKLEAQDLRETIAALRRALAAEPAERDRDRHRRRAR